MTLITIITDLDMLSRESLNQLYHENPCLWFYFVQGAPVYSTVNYNVSKGVANGTGPYIMHSLGFHALEDVEKYNNEINVHANSGDIIVLEILPAVIYVEVPDADLRQWDHNLIHQDKLI